MLSPIRFETGAPLRLHTNDGRETTAHVVSCQPMGPDNRTWRLGAKLDRPDNFWGLSDCPADWTAPSGPLTARLKQISSPAASVTPKLTSPAGLPPEVMLDMVARRLEAPLKRMIAESLRPIQAEVTAIKETMARRDANPSRFEVSLSQIPPDLEQQLEQRVKKDLGPKMLEESRNQYAHLLEAAKTTIDQRTNEGYEDFRRRATDELKIVEQRAQEISTHISANAREQLRRGLEDFQQKLLDGGNSLKRLSEELQEFLQQNLHDEHNARRQELEELRAFVAAESSRLSKDVEYLDVRIAKLNESARTLESGLDARLGQMAANTVKDARTQLETMANEALEQLSVHSTKMLGDQVDEACAKMAIAQKDIIASVPESLGVQVTNASRAFEQSIDETAKLAVERWRGKLAASLNTLAKSLGEQFRVEAEASGSQR